jgi:hypothetical protein
MSNKIENTFSKAAIELARLQKAFAENSKLEKAVMESKGDASVIAEVRSHLANAIIALTPVTLTEGVLDGDDEDGFMARSQLYFMAKDAIALHGRIDDRDDLEPWVQSKIAQASKDMDSVRRYTEYNAMKDQVEPEVHMHGPEVESLEEDPVDRKMQVTKADKDGNTPAWQAYKAGDPRYEYTPPVVKEDAGYPQDVELAGDSIWMEDEMWESDYITVKDIDVQTDEDGNTSVHVMHNGPWEIYTDTGFAAEISKLVGKEVDWSEQGMQAEGVAHLEGFLEEAYESIRTIQSATSKLNQSGQGVRNKTDKEPSANPKIKTKVERVAEETKFDDKPKHSELKTVANDMMKSALTKAKKKAEK